MTIRQSKLASGSELTLWYERRDFSIYIQLYESMLKPVMCYGSEVWGFNENKNLERVELRFLKYILHLPLSALCVES